MIALRLAAGSVVTTVSGWLGASQVSTNGPDLSGIALLITSIAGLIGTIGGLYLATRKKPMDAQDIALIALAERLSRDGDHDDPA